MPVKLGRTHASLGVALAIVGGVAFAAITPSGSYDKAFASSTAALVVEDAQREANLDLYQQQQAEAAAVAAEAAAVAAAAEQAAAAAAAQVAAEEAARAEAAQRAARDAQRTAATDPRSAARAMLGEFGWGESQFGCLDRLWQKESNWNYQAANRSSGAFGIPQALPGGKMASAGADWRTNPATQIRWGLGYIKDVYGTPCGAWAHSQSVNWY